MLQFGFPSQNHFWTDDIRQILALKISVRFLRVFILLVFSCDILEIMIKFFYFCAGFLCSIYKVLYKLIRLWIFSVIYPTFCWLNFNSKQYKPIFFSTSPKQNNNFQVTKRIEELSNITRRTSTILIHRHHQRDEESR